MKKFWDRFDTVSAWVLLEKRTRKFAGRVLWKYDKITVTCGIQISLQSVSLDFDKLGTAKDSGYDKQSASFSDCLNKWNISHEKLSGVGKEACRAFLEKQGYIVLEAI